MDDFVGANDLRKTAVVDLGSNKLLVGVSDPYGFWTIHYERGQTPEVLKGQYTTQAEAMKAVDVYLKNLPPSQKKEVKQVLT